MQIRLYLDEDAMDSDLVRALRLRGVDVTTALDLDLTNSTDEEHLQRAITNGRVLYSFNVSDFMALHTVYLAAGKDHTGLILGQQQRYSVGEQMRPRSASSKFDPLRVCAIELSFLVPGDKVAFLPACQFKQRLKTTIWSACPGECANQPVRQGP